MISSKLYGLCVGRASHYMLVLNEIYLNPCVIPHLHLIILQYAIMEDDPNLAKLRKFGSRVYNSVCETLLEIAEWNPSGRYIVSVPWDFEGKRKATMAQIV